MIWTIVFSIIIAIQLFNMAGTFAMVKFFRLRDHCLNNVMFLYKNEIISETAAKVYLRELDPDDKPDFAALLRLREELDEVYHEWERSNNASDGLFRPK